MIKVLINGINGRMGKEVANLVMKNNKMHLLGGLDRKLMHNLPYSTFTNTDGIFEKPDVIIDFSTPEATINLLPYCIKNKIAIVIATTGFNDEEQEKIKQASSYIPVFQSANMAYEITLMANIAKKLSKELEDAEIEIVETHHSEKNDSPSGTALMIADSINDANDGNYLYNFNRVGYNQKRNPREIGFSSIRGGNIVGEHSVLFFSPNETLEIKHTAYSRNIFAQGAIKAALFITEKSVGLYSMNDLIFNF